MLFCFYNDRLLYHYKRTKPQIVAKNFKSLIKQRLEQDGYSLFPIVYCLLPIAYCLSYLVHHPDARCGIVALILFDVND